MKPWTLALLTACAAVHASGGELTRRFELTLERALHGGPPRYTRELVLGDLELGSTRRFHEFSGDLSGRYLGALAVAGPDGVALARSLAPRIFALQQPDGGFGSPLSGRGAAERDMDKLWGHGRLLVGLLEYHQTTRDPQSLEAARRLGDFLVTHVDRFNDPSVREGLRPHPGAHGYICWTQNVEGLALLAEATGDARYRDAAAAIARASETLPGQHAHGLLSTLRGMLLLARDDAEFIPQVEQEWDFLEQSGNIAWYGGPPEYISAPGRDEGCASADWLRLNLALWRLTGRERYLAAAEDALFNAFYGNQLPDGDFAHITFSPEGYRAGAVESWWCCTLHGLRTFPAAREAAFRVVDGELYYDLPVDGRGAAGDLEIEADAELAREGRVTFRVLRAPNAPATLHIRKPARTAELRSPFGVSREAWLELDRVWETGESVEVDYTFETKIETADGAKIVRRGPWTLGISEGADMAFFNEGFQSHRVDWDSLTAGDRPSRVAAEFEAKSFGSEPGEVTFRPIAERWESSGNSLRWTTKFDPPPPPVAEAARISVVRVLYESRKALLAGFAAGVVVTGLAAWLWRRRKR